MDYGFYKESYYNSNGKLVDFFQKTISLVPCNSTTSSKYDKTCGIKGISGEFFRKISGSTQKPIVDFEAGVVNPVRSFLSEEASMQDSSIDEFVKVLKDIFYSDGNFSVINASFIKYVPLYASYVNKTVANKYVDGQKKIANYLYSMLPDEYKYEESAAPNLFCSIIKTALEQGQTTQTNPGEKGYYILPFIREAFTQDLDWLLKSHDDYIIVKYIDHLLQFYVCYSILQVILKLGREEDSIDSPSGLYFMMISETASAKKEAVVQGWSSYVSGKLEKLFGRFQAIDIINTLFGEQVGLYPQIRQALQSVDFESEGKSICEMVLTDYQNDKRAVLQERDTFDASKLPDRIDTTVSSYEEFFEKLEKLCMDLQSPEYARLGQKVKDIMKVKFLQSRRGNDVLVLDEEMLVFLIAMFTHEKRTKLDDMYVLFNKHGIYFNIESRNIIEQYLLKSNLLDRKSDSGETQYVTVIL